jgi:hypothetical protein
MTVWGRKDRKKKMESGFSKPPWMTKTGASCEIFEA